MTKTTTQGNPPSWLWMPLLLAAVWASAPAAAQSSFSDDSHWDPRFKPPVRFVDVRNIETTADYLIISGNRIVGSGTSFENATVYRPTGETVLHDLEIPGWEEVDILAGNSRIFARRGTAEGDLAELDLEAGTATPLPNPPVAQSPLTTFGDDLYALSKGQPFKLVGATWDSLGPPLDYDVVDQWVVGASGMYVAVGPTTCSPLYECSTSLWRFADGAWTQIGTAVGTFNSPVTALAIDESGRLIVAGGFSEVSEVAASRVARWDGTAWSPLGQGFGFEMDRVYDLAVLDTVVYAGGGRVLEWGGSTWTSLGARRSVADLEVAGQRLFASGWFAAMGDTAAYRVAEWDPSARRWLPVLPVVGQGIGGSVSAIEIGSDGSVFVGGSFSAAGGVVANKIARWDSVRWSNIGDGVPGAVLSIAAGSTDLFVGTDVGVAVTDLDSPSWSYLPGLTDGSTLRWVEVAVVGDDLYAAASIQEVGALSYHAVFHWTGSEWQMIGQVRDGAGRGGVGYLVVDEAGSLYAGGAFTEIGGVEARNIARWDGVAWHPLGDGVTECACPLASGGGRIFAAVNPLDTLYEWDVAGQTWSSIPLPPAELGSCFAEVSSMAWRADGLYAGFEVFCLVTTGRKAQNDDMSLVMRWNGEAWDVPGSGIRNGYVQALASSGDDLYVGGQFMIAGGRHAANFARWNESIVLEVDDGELPVGPLLDQNFPNPFNSLTTVRFSLDRTAANARLEVYDQLGRQVATLLDSPFGPGPHEVSFDAAGLAGGIYMYRLSVDGRAAAKRMVVVR